MGPTNESTSVKRGGNALDHVRDDRYLSARSSAATCLHIILRSLRKHFVSQWAKRVRMTPSANVLRETRETVLFYAVAKDMDRGDVETPNSLLGAHFCGRSEHAMHALHIDARAQAIDDELAATIPALL